METQRWPSAEDFDGWYADMSGSPVKDEIQRRHLGLPPHLLSTSLLGWAAIAEVAEALRLSPGDTMLDVACGRGGYGLEIAARTGARLVRVGFSAEAVRQACEHAWRLGPTAGLPPRESRRGRRSTPATTLRCSHSATKGMRSLEILGLTRRVIVTATAPLTLTR
jgi:Mycolic acid cyclopropane synthetase